MLRSTNCAAYTDTISLLVETEASSAGGDDDKCTNVALPPVFSCQKSQFEEPDAATEQMLRARAVDALAELSLIHI